MILGKFYRCSYEYYGYPKLLHGTCRPCNCNSWGMASEECDEETGQCNCKPDVIGKDCSICVKKNYVLSSKGCIRKSNITQFSTFDH